MSDPFIGEIKLWALNFAPKGWALCNGQLLPINQNQALFALIGTYYGGDGRVNFGLPNLQGRVPIHAGNGHTLGEVGGEASHTLVSTEMPGHSHQAKAAAAPGDNPSPQGRAWGTQTTAHAYASSGAAANMAGAAVANTGGGQAHENRPPFLVLNFCISLLGIFPSRS